MQDKAQSDGFIKAAKEMGLDESGTEFNRALDKLVPKRRKSN